ncbi:MAG: nucleotide exchange factor GrpE [Candidatus Spechtbacteria bacterium]|nr:nucleotide exchange factor GrpE [Candidatus Spechtbacteria bacterium]
MTKQEIHKKEPDYIEEISGEVEEQFKKLKKKFKEAQREAKEHLDGWQRERADFANYKKDIEKYLQSASDNVKEEVLLQYINTVDNIELMMEHAHDAIVKTDWYSGVENAHKHAIGALKGLGVKEIHTKPGDEFDPKLHEAVEGEGGVIEKVVQKGYMLGEKVIRPAKVRVKNNKKQ